MIKKYLTVNCSKWFIKNKINKNNKERHWNKIIKLECKYKAYNYHWILSVFIPVGNEKSIQIFKQFKPWDLSRYKYPFSPQSVPNEFFNFQYLSVAPTNCNSWFTVL